MNEGGGLESVVVPFAAHVEVGEAVKLVIDEGKELLESCLVTLAPVGEELRNFTLVWHGKTARGELRRSIPQPDVASALACLEKRGMTDSSRKCRFRE